MREGCRRFGTVGIWKSDVDMSDCDLDGCGR